MCFCMHWEKIEEEINTDFSFYTQVASDLSVFIEQVVFLLWLVVTLVKDTMEEYLEDWKYYEKL